MHAPIQPIAAPPSLSRAYEAGPHIHGIQADDLALLTRGLGQGLNRLLGCKPVPPGPKIACLSQRKSAPPVSRPTQECSRPF